MNKNFGNSTSNMTLSALNQILNTLKLPILGKSDQNISDPRLTHSELFPEHISNNYFEEPTKQQMIFDLKQASILKEKENIDQESFYKNKQNKKIHTSRIIQSPIKNQPFKRQNSKKIILNNNFQKENKLVKNEEKLIIFDNEKMPKKITSKDYFESYLYFLYSEMICLPYLSNILRTFEKQTKENSLIFDQKKLICESNCEKERRRKIANRISKICTILKLQKKTHFTALHFIEKCDKKQSFNFEMTPDSATIILFIISKFEEVRHLSILMFLKFCSVKYDLISIIKFEENFLNTFQYKLMICSVFDYYMIFVKSFNFFPEIIEKGFFYLEILAFDINFHYFDKKLIALAVCMLLCNNSVEKDLSVKIPLEKFGLVKFVLFENEKKLQNFMEEYEIDVSMFEFLFCGDELSCVVQLLLKLLEDFSIRKDKVILDKYKRICIFK